MPANNNSLKTITAGQAYLVYMNSANTLAVSGVRAVETSNGLSLQNGWNLIGFWNLNIYSFSIP